MDDCQRLASERAAAPSASRRRFARPASFDSSQRRFAADLERVALARQCAEQLDQLAHLPVRAPISARAVRLSAARDESSVASARDCQRARRENNQTSWIGRLAL